MNDKNLNVFGLSERNMNEIFAILKKYPEIKTVTIFGSRAKGNFKTGSDIDLAIMNKIANQKIVNKIVSDFEESSLPFKVDLIEFQNLQHNELKEHIERAGILFYNSNE